MYFSLTSIFSPLLTHVCQPKLLNCLLINGTRRAAHFGELAPECVKAYYKYGCALLYKAQEEADPLVSMPKKEDVVSQEESNKDSSVAAVNGESSAASVSNVPEEAAKANGLDGAPNDS